MNKIEKLLLSILFTSLSLMAFFFIPLKDTIFTIVSFIVATGYLIGGYWIIKRPDSDKNKPLYIFGGIAFGTAILPLSYSIKLIQEPFVKILPAINGIFFISLSILFIVNNLQKRSNKNVHPLLIRAFIILSITAFFTLTPVTFKPYRTAIIVLNSGDDYIKANMDMFNYTYDYCKAEKKSNQGLALHYAKKANDAGLKWLSAFRNPVADYWKIGITFDNLYDAYSSLGYEFYQKGDYNGALQYLNNADFPLYAYERNSLDWNLEFAQAINQKALCYMSMGQYATADSLFQKAIAKHFEYTEKKNSKLALIVSNIGESFYYQGEIGNSIECYKMALEYYSNDNETNINDLAYTYHGLMRDYFMCDSIEKAHEIITLLKNRSNLTPIRKWKNDLFEGIYYSRMNDFKASIKILKKNLEKAPQIFAPNDQNIAENHLTLASSYFSLARYDLARQHLLKGIDITIKNYNTSSSRYAGYLKHLALINKETGNLKVAKRQLNEVMEIYKKELAPHDKRKAYVLSELGDLAISFGNFSEAMEYTSQSLSNIHCPNETLSTGYSPILCTAAYIHYFNGNISIADSLYDQALQINRNSNYYSQSSSSFALNGKGLIALEKGKLIEANDYFNMALEMCTKIFTDTHPYCSTIYLNIAQLKLSENKLSDFRYYISKAEEINLMLFDTNNIKMAEIYETYADFEVKIKNIESAKNYYKKAISIYSKTYDDEHYKVHEIKRKLLQMI